MRTAHRLLDVSTFDGQYVICECGHWKWLAPWQESRQTCDDLYAEHVRLFDIAEASLDDLEAMS